MRRETFFSHPAHADKVLTDIGGGSGAKTGVKVAAENGVGRQRNGVQDIVKCYQVILSRQI